MESGNPEASTDLSYKEKKREELRIFFKDAKLPKAVIDKAIENELSTIKEFQDRPYIAASFPGAVRSEYEVMTGQPFTNVEDRTKPITSEEAREIINNNPVITEKARQIQIVAHREKKDIAIPLEEINIASYSDMNKELDSADGDQVKLNNIKFRNMQALCQSVTDYRTKLAKGKAEVTIEEVSEAESEEREFEAIENMVSQYTDKSYETRFQETKDMLSKMADKYEDPNTKPNEKVKIEFKSDPILKESSSQLIKGQFKRTAYEEIKETYSINAAMNIPTTNKPVASKLAAITKEKKKVSDCIKSDINNMSELFDIEGNAPKDFEKRLKDTEDAMKFITTILNKSSMAKEKNVSKENIADEIKREDNSEIMANTENQTPQVLTSAEENNESTEKTADNMKLEHDSEVASNVTLTNTTQVQIVQRFDERMEQTLQTALDDLYDVSNNENRDNNELEYKEMKNLAKNIVEGADNLSTLIREDITNKLNSMNELLNDVNEALENSRKSNLAYQKLKDEGIIKPRQIPDSVPSSEIIDLTNEPQQSSEIIDLTNEPDEPNAQTEAGEEKPMSTVTDADIGDIFSAIGKLNSEIRSHEDRINKSKARYEIRNQECKNFMKEVNDVLQKSHTILHPQQATTNTQFNKENTKECIKTDKSETSIFSVEDDKVIEGEKPRKELWDVKAQFKDEQDKRLAEFKQQQLERDKRINDLLYDIKDKMKDNKEVLRLANNLLRKDDCKDNNQGGCKIQELPQEIDTKAQGDCAADEKVDNNTDINKQATIGDARSIKEIDLERRKRIAAKRRDEEEEKEKERRRINKEKRDREIEEANRGPQMTKEFIRQHCKQHKLYCTPHLNDILYLHFKGFSKIENLEEYTGLKCIFLENNGIQRIEGLDAQSELKCLYLHYNVLRKIENLHGCPKLDTLNLDHNFVPKIENLEAVPVLHTLSIAHNMLSSVSDLEQLKFCRNLSVLDLSYNRIEDPLVIDILADMDILKVLVLTGNPVTRAIPAYRKTLTLRLRELLNLDNRPVFPRDRACAEAWQRGGVDEEIAERKRWIARDQEKTMESVRYLIRMRDANKAAREAREKEAREKLGLPPVEDKAAEEKKDNDEGPSTLEQKFGPAEVKVKEGVAVDMLTGSEAEDSTSEDSSDSEGGKKDDEPATGNIQWSPLMRGTQMVQEIREEVAPPAPAPVEDYWYGYHGPPKRKETKLEERSFTSDFENIRNLLFAQPSHIQKTNKPEKEAMKIEELDEKGETKENVAEKKPLIEVIESPQLTIEDNKVEEKVETVEDTTVKGVVEEGNLIIDHDKKVITEKSGVEKEEVNNVEKFRTNEKVKNIKNKSMKSITITEINPEEKVDQSQSLVKYDKPTKKDTLEVKPEEKASKTQEVVENDDKAKDSKEDNSKQTTENKDTKDETEGQCCSKTSTEEKKPSMVHSSGDGVSLMSYMRSVNSEDPEEDEALRPSAEDLEIFAELDREQLEREARIARGEPAVDPMKLYDKKTMDAFHLAEERVPAHAQPAAQRVAHTTYRHDNAFDRVALSQLTGGEKPDETKVKLTHVPGAVLYQYVNQAPLQVDYEIGEEKIDSEPSSGETDSIHITSDNASTTTEDEEPKAAETKKFVRPKTATKTTKTNPNDRPIRGRISITPRSGDDKSKKEDKAKKEDKGKTEEKTKNEDKFKSRKSMCVVDKEPPVKPIVSRRQSIATVSASKPTDTKKVIKKEPVKKFEPVKKVERAKSAMEKNVRVRPENVGKSIPSKNVKKSQIPTKDDKIKTPKVSPREVEEEKKIQAVDDVVNKEIKTGQINEDIKVKQTEQPVTNVETAVDISEENASNVTTEAAVVENVESVVKTEVLNTPEEHVDKEAERIVSSSEIKEQKYLDGSGDAGGVADVAEDRPVLNEAASTSYESMMFVERSEAERSIISTINSYEDDRFPSQGVNYSDMSENARIDQSVASAILERTLHYEERAMLQQLDALSSRAGKLDNQTNTLLEHMAEDLEHRYTLPEVSHILTAHMDAAEQTWRAGNFVPSYVRASPPESIADENETTLVPSDTSLDLEETLIPGNVPMDPIREHDDSGIGDNINDSNVEYKSFIDEDGEDKEEKESIVVNMSGEEEVFEDCIDLSTVEEEFKRVDENLSLEMKIALGIEDKALE
ncbi:defective transmitter release [Choristoneura fumiferana]|uniref:defective transmitter release n=1 Tax=Choristoneura fumiferana TaxID=7141 RepID=UPI003D153FC9